MKKILLILSVFVFLGMTSPVRGVAFFEELFEKLDLGEEKEDFSIFSDPAFTQPTHNFSPGQMVYVRVESLVSGDREKTLRILDAEKREIQKLNLNQTGSLFTASFPAPNNPGVYYIDIKIEDLGGSKFASQENINVGEATGAVSVSSEAKAEVETKATGEISPTAPLATTTPEPVDEKPTSISFVSQILEFFQNLFLGLTQVLTDKFK